METLDCVVIGAGESPLPLVSQIILLTSAPGWFGLGAAKQFHCISPAASLAVFEAADDLGGTWATHRLYPGLRSNNLVGTYEFPDFPLDKAAYGLRTGDYIPGRIVNAYLHAYAARFGIAPLVRLRTKVLAAEHLSEGGWILTVAGPDDAPETKVLARRLVVATGLTSEPHIPRFEGQDTFGGPIFHGRDFAQHADTIRAGSTVAVLGAGKTAFDAVYAYAMAGVKVNWIIRGKKKNKKKIPSPKGRTAYLSANLQHLAMGPPGFHRPSSRP